MLGFFDLDGLGQCRNVFFKLREEHLVFGVETLREPCVEGFQLLLEIGMFGFELTVFALELLAISR